MASHSRRLNDEQLASAVLDIPDPMAVENLSLERPDQALTPTILGEYHLSTDADPIWCCHCKARRPWNGFVIENETGFRYLIGSHCGPKHYDLSFALAKRQHSELRSRQGVLVRVRKIQAAEQSILEVVSEILHSSGLRAIDDTQKALKAASGNVFVRLSSLSRNGSPLTESVRVRDFEAERRRDENREVKSEEKPRPIYTFENRSLGLLDGAAVVRTRGDCRDRLIELKAALGKLVHLRPDGTDVLSTSKLTAITRGAEETLAQAQISVAEARAAPRFFDPANLGRLERWSSQHADFELRGEDGALRVISKKDPGGLIASLPLIVLPDLPTP